MGRHARVKGSVCALRGFGLRAVLQREKLHLSEFVDMCVKIFAYKGKCVHTGV